MAVFFRARDHCRRMEHRLEASYADPEAAADLDAVASDDRASETA